ncbi:MAG: hypothetical protein ACYDEV_00565 [Acidiferrobacter sp.]
MSPFRKSALPVTLAGTVPIVSVVLVIADFVFGVPQMMPEYILLATLCYWYLTSRRDRALSERAFRTTTPSYWAVTMGGVPVGTLSDAQYAALFLSVLRDRQTALRQARHLIRMTTISAGQMLLLVPLVLFWVVVWMATVAHSQYKDMVHLFLTHGLGTFLFWIRAAIIVAVTAKILSLALGLKTPPSAYEDAMHQMVRAHFALAAGGPLTLLWESHEPPPLESGCRSAVQKFHCGN